MHNHVASNLKGPFDPVTLPDRTQAWLSVQQLLFCLAGISVNLLSNAASVEQFSPPSLWQTPPEKNSAARLAPCSVQTGKNKRSTALVRIVTQYHTGMCLQFGDCSWCTETKMPFEFFVLPAFYWEGDRAILWGGCRGYGGVDVSLLPTECFVGYPVHG